jgi:predicted RNase H-like HicB family nuclease
MSAGRIMSLDNYNFDGFIINLYVDEQGDWLAHFQEIPTISAFGDTPQEALEELKTAWELVKEDYQDKHREIPIAKSRLKIAN